MKKLMVFLMIATFLLLPVTAHAWTMAMTWSAVPGATTYKVEQSADNGVTWTIVGGPLTTPGLVITNGTEPGLVLFRVSACNSNGCTVRSGDGLWHNEAWAPPAMATDLLVH